MNQRHSRIKFEIEKSVTSPEGKSLSLIDFIVTITNDERSEFEFYKKKGKKPLFVHYTSALRKRTKVNIIKNERKRISQRCSSQQTKQKHNKELNDILHINGYPECIIDKSELERNITTTNPRKEANTEWLYFLIPHISDAVDYKLKRMFQKEGIQVRIAHKSSTLRQVLKLRKNSESCNKPECPISETGLCFRKGVVYKITCKKCQGTYIWSTIKAGFHIIVPIVPIVPKPNRRSRRSYGNTA